MWCTVYRLYDGHGNRLPNDVAKASGIVGWLVYRTKRPISGMPYSHAVLLPAPGAPDAQSLLPELQHASALVCEGGIRLRGQDFCVNHRFIRQSWWAVPTAAP